MNAMTPAARPLTRQLVDFAAGLDWAALPPEVRASARDHFVDTVGVIIAGMPGAVSQAVAGVLGLGRSGSLPVPGSGLKASARDFALICGTAAHGIELDDGYRQGTVHPGVTVVPALLAIAGERRISGQALLTALTAGYEIICALGGAGHPALRDRGYHPTPAVGPMGVAAAAGLLHGLDARRIETAMGIAASTCGGLFAFLAGGGDVKRLHGGFGARGGLEAMLFAEAGIDAPSGIVEIPSGWAQAFAGSALSFDLPPGRTFRILDCYFKPHACCRHLQPAFEATVEMMAKHGIRPADIQSIEVHTYGISAHHASVGWESFASAQLSFPYVMALAMNVGRADLQHFDDAHRAKDWVGESAAKLTVRKDADIDARYPNERPSRVTIRTATGALTEERAEALGSPEYPLSAEDICAKFTRLVTPVLGAASTEELLDRLWHIDRSEDAGSCLALAQS